MVLIIAGSAVAAAVASIQRLAYPTTGMTHLVAVGIAAVIGFVGNEVAAQVRIRTGRKIGSAALVADGLHARTDAITSLAVLASVGGAAVGWRWIDPIVGLLIALAIAMVTYTAAKQILARLMDAVDPAVSSRSTPPCWPCLRSTRWTRCGCAGSGTLCTPKSTCPCPTNSLWPRRTRSRTTPSTDYGTGLRAWPRPRCTPTPLAPTPTDSQCLCQPRT